MCDDVIEVRFGGKFIYRIDFRSIPIKLLLLPLDYDFIGRTALNPEEILKCRRLVIDVFQKGIFFVQEAIDRDAEPVKADPEKGE